MKREIGWERHKVAIGEAFGNLHAVDVGGAGFHGAPLYRVARERDTQALPPDFSPAEPSVGESLQE